MFGPIKTFGFHPFLGSLVFIFDDVYGCRCVYVCAHVCVCVRGGGMYVYVCALVFIATYVSKCLNVEVGIVCQTL